MSNDTRTSAVDERPQAAGGRSSTTSALVWIGGVLAVGCALLAIAHLGVRIPVLSALGPGGDRPVIPAAVAFGVATVLQTLVTVGVARHRTWAWAAGVVVAVVILTGAAMPFRGAISVIGIALAGAELALLLTPGVRRTILG